MASEMIYAIDFGTSNSLLSAAEQTRVHAPIPLDAKATDTTILRSVLYSPASGIWHFGADAIDAYSEHAAEGRIFRSIKKFLPDGAFSGTFLHGRFYNLSELIAVYLGEMRQRANTHFERDVTRIMLGRPAVFSLDADADRLAQHRLEAAAKLAGFKEVNFCPEPVAAAYEFRLQLTEPKIVLIADFGGGTSDFTVLRLEPDGFREKDVLAIGGIPIAGDRFDGAIMRHDICRHFGTEVVYRLPMGSNDLRLPKHLVQRMCSPADMNFLAKQDIVQFLKDAQKWSLPGPDAKRMDQLFILVEEHLGYHLFRQVEQTKMRLSTQESDLFEFHHPGIDIEEEIKKSAFETYTREHVEKIIKVLDETVRDAGLTHAQIEIVWCTGGTAKIPALHAELAQRFGHDKLRQHRHFHSVVQGLGEKARMLL